MNKNNIYLDVKDHSVSQEMFQLVYNTELDFLETSPKPEGEKLWAYYKSEDYISHTDTKRNIFEHVYHLVRSISLKRKIKLISSFNTEHKNLLDIGCGTGDFLQASKNADWHITGIEPDESARNIANKKTNNSVLKTSQIHTLKDKSFDVITLWHVLEHLPDLDAQIKTFKRLLKSNGRLVIAVPNYKSADAIYYKSFWAAYDVPRHLWHFSKTSISKLFGLHDLQLEKTLPMKFDVFYVCLLSEKYATGFMNPFRAFWQGWKSNLKAKSSGEFSSLIYVLKNTK